jgi:hypothetical protein
MTTVNITVDFEEIAREVPVSKFIKAYGIDSIMGQLTMREIISHLDIDSVLEHIGEERIHDFLKLGHKEIA